MKKVLALVLTLAMLVGCLTVGLSAAQVITENKTVNKIWQFHAGNSYAPIDVGSQGDNFDVEMDIRIDVAGKGLKGWDGLAVGPVFNESAVGIDGKTVAGSYAVGTWYHLRLDAEGGQTTIYVDDQNLGTVDGTCTLYDGNQAFWTWDNISIDNLKVGSYFNDMEGGLGDYQGQPLEDETITYVNENVSIATNKIWQFHAGNSYAPIDVGSQGDNFDVEMDIRIDVAGKGLKGWDGLAVGPVFNESAVGIDGKTVAGSYAVGTWYHLRLDAEGGQTTIYVDDQNLGTVDGTCTLYEGNQAFWTWDNISIDNLKVGSYFNDMEGGLGDYQGQPLEEEKVLARYDLGLKYWQFHAGNSYAPIDVGSQGDNFDVEMDIRIDVAGKGLKGWDGLAVGPVFNESAVGIDGKTVAGSYAVGTWYHLRLDAEGGQTTIYVDDQNLGTVDGTCTLYEGNQAFWTWDNISIDNLKVGSYFNDMEGGLGDYQGQPLEYEIKKTTIFDNFETYPVEGEATLVNAVYNEAKDPSSGDTNALYTTTTHTAGAVPTNYIVNFDLAIYPDKEGTISSDKTMDGSWVEFIVNKFGSSDNSRLKIGNKFVGKNKDLYYYGEDEIVKDMQPWAPGEFHNVTIQISNGKAIIYIDKVQVYESPVGMDNWDDLCIFYFDNCNAIMDNYRIYDAKTFETKVDTLKFSTGEEYVKTLSDVKAENFCEANGCHINSWARTTDPKCYEVGTNTYKCWICGTEEAKTEVPMLEHNYAHYDIERVNEEGLVFTYCTTSEGCTERRYIQLPAAEDHTGELMFYHDFQDDFLKVTSSECGFEVFEDGVAKYISSDYNYNQIEFGREFSSTELNGGIKVGFDFSIDGTFDTEASLGDYGHSFDFMLGKGTLGAATIKYNMDTQKFYINSTNKNFREYETEGTYPLVPGEVYNIEAAFSVNEDEMTAELAVYFNGVEILRMDEFDAYDYLPYSDSIKCLLMHVFGLKINVDNLVIGNYDFSWNRDYAGDVDGDYDITGADALLMRKYLAKIVDLDALYVSRADVNGDGYIDAIDQLRIRKALVG